MFNISICIRTKQLIRKNFNEDEPGSDPGPFISPRV